MTGTARGAASINVSLSQGRITVLHGDTGEELHSTDAIEGDWDRIWETLRSLGE